MRRIATSLVASALTIALVGSIPAAAAPYPTVRSGTKNCGANLGSIVLISSVEKYDGVRATTTPVGSPVGGWSRTLKPFLSAPDVDYEIALVSKNANANWSMASVSSPAALGLPNARAACTLQSVSGTVLKSVTPGSKTCPSGQTVIIRSSGYTPAGHFWKRSGATTTFGVRHSGGPGLVFYATDTGARSITAATVKSFELPGYGHPDNALPSATLTCSSSEETIGTVSWP